MDLVFVLTAFTALFAIINPLGNVPFFVAVTEGLDKAEKRTIAPRTAFVSVSASTCAAGSRGAASVSPAAA